MNDKPKGLFSNIAEPNDKNDKPKYLSDNLVDMEQWCKEKDVSFELMKKICISTDRLYYKISGNYYHYPGDLLQAYNDSLTTSKVNLEKKIKNKKKVEECKRAILKTIDDFFEPTTMSDIKNLEAVLEVIFIKGEPEKNLKELNMLAAEKSTPLKEKTAEKLLKDIETNKALLNKLKNDTDPTSSSKQDDSEKPPVN